MEEKKEDFKHIVRIANTDLDGNKAILDSLRKIKGVSFMFANMACSIGGIEKRKKTGYLLDSEISKLDEIIKNPKKFNTPAYMLNRRKDYDTGEDMHILTTDIKFVRDSDIKRMAKTKSYKAIRHSWGLPVRGQRTRSNFRKNKGRVTGVKRKKVKAGRV